MRRAAIVIAATGAGLAAVLSFHPGSSALHDAATTTTPSTSATSTGSGSTSAGSGSTTTPSTGATSTGSGSSSGSSGSSTGTRTLTGTDEAIAGGQYGDLQVKVTIDNGKIVKVDLAALNTNDPRSGEIASYAVPQLEQQTISAQSANIQGVSGATYTSQAYEASLQAALDKA